VESKLGPLGTSSTEWPIVPTPGDYDDGEFGVIKIGRGNRSTRRKLVPAPLCPPQIPLDQTRARTRATAVGSQRLTAWAMAGPPNAFVDGFMKETKDRSHARRCPGRCSNQAPPEYELIILYTPVVNLWLCKQRQLLGNARNMKATIEELRFICGTGRDVITGRFGV
jgi:hypothetical protein